MLFHRLWRVFSSYSIISTIHHLNNCAFNEENLQVFLKDWNWHSSVVFRYKEANRLLEDWVMQLNKFLTYTANQALLTRTSRLWLKKENPLKCLTNHSLRFLDWSDELIDWNIAITYWNASLRRTLTFSIFTQQTGRFQQRLPILLLTRRLKDWYSLARK